MEIEMDGDVFTIEIDSATYSEPCHPRWADCWGDVVGGYEISFRAWLDGQLVTDKVTLDWLERNIVKQFEEESHET
jgi:hypothetical protein